MAYSDGEKAEAIIRLAVNKYDFQKTADQIGLPVQTLRRWNKNVPKKGVADLLERAIERMLTAIPANWSGRDWAIALGILMDKWLLLQGEPTERTENWVKHFEELTDDERHAVIEEAQELVASLGTSRDFGSNGRGE